jgi:hypothetical protein
MDKNSLKDTLKSLHADLESTPKVDPETKALLRDLDQDIRQLLEKEAGDQSVTSGLVRRAQAISARLAIRHPHIEPAMREVADMLARMGI